MIIKVLLFLILPLISLSSFSQSVSGNLSLVKNDSVKLYCFNGFENYIIDQTKSDKNGNFSLTYSSKDKGMGFLKSSDNRPYFIVLSGEDIEIKGEALGFVETVQTLKGLENLLFAQYSSEHPRRDQALSAWNYLNKIYKNDSLFAIHKIANQGIDNEINRIKEEDSLFLANLPKDSYLTYYLPLRKLVSSVSTIAQYRTEEIPASIAFFRNLDYTDWRLEKSGLQADVIESHFWLIENSGRSLDSVFIEMNKSIDAMVENLLVDEQKLNKISEHLFKFLEKRSLFTSSEYLALKLLNERSCTSLTTDFAYQLESYRAMKKGNIATDFKFENIVANGYEDAKLPKKLSDIKDKYTIVFFGASWCSHCPQELVKIANLYEKWKEQSVEVVFVSLDVDEEIFKNYAKIFPFISVCDYQKWESPIVKSYYVFATPIIYLLDNKREILLRPNSVEQIDAWVDWFLVQKNSYK
jgi:thiol-disulfide isomerase/thioredoxin